MSRLNPNDTLYCPHCGRSQLDNVLAFVQTMDAVRRPTTDVCTECLGEFLLTPMSDNTIIVTRLDTRIEA